MDFCGEEFVVAVCIEPVEDVLFFMENTNFWVEEA